MPYNCNLMSFNLFSIVFDVGHWQFKVFHYVFYMHFRFSILESNFQ